MTVVSKFPKSFQKIRWTRARLGARPMASKWTKENGLKHESKQTYCPLAVDLECVTNVLCCFME